MIKETLNTNIKNNKSTALIITNETIVTMSVIPKSGKHNNHRVTLEQSPDNGNTWIESVESVNGNSSFITITLAATQVRACVCEVEKESSEVTVFILAR